MSLSMYDASIPVLLRGLENLSAVLEKGEAHAKAKGFDSTVLVQSRLAPDMHPLSRQIQIATDMSKGCAARLAGIEIPSYEDNEQTMGDLQARIRKTLDFLRSVTPEQLEGSEARQLAFKTRTREWAFNGQAYLLDFVIPNVFFHLTIAYAILRHNGVELGKMDFLGTI